MSRMSLLSMFAMNASHPPRLSSSARKSARSREANGEHIQVFGSMPQQKQPKQQPRAAPIHWVEQYLGKASWMSRFASAPAALRRKAVAKGTRGGIGLARSQQQATRLLRHTRSKAGNHLDGSAMDFDVVSAMTTQPETRLLLDALRLSRREMVRVLLVERQRMDSPDCSHQI